MSLRKSARDTSEPSPAPTCQTLLAQRSNSGSWVTPRSRVMPSNSERPGDLRGEEGSPPWRCLTTSVVRFSGLILLMPATVRPSHSTRNLKFLYGSKRCALTVNSAIRFLQLSKIPGPLERELTGGLLDLDHHELGRADGRDADEHVDDAVRHVLVRRGLAVALDEVRLARGAALEGALAEERVQVRGRGQPDLLPQALVVGLEHDPLQATLEALLDMQREPSHRYVLPRAVERVGALQRARAPHQRAGGGEGAQTVDAERVEQSGLTVRQIDGERAHSDELRLRTRRRLPHAALGVGARDDARDRAGGREGPQPPGERVGE